MTRPAGIICSIYLFYLLFRKKIFFNKSNLSSLIIITLLSIIYYIPYISFELNKHFISALNVSDTSNSMNNTLMSLIYDLLTYFKKFLYIFGFQEGESQNFFIRYTKMIFAIYFINGFLFLIFNPKKPLFFLILTYLLFITFFLAPSWRYILPIGPILFYYSSNFLYYAYLRVFK